MYRISYTDGIPTEIYHGDNLIRHVQTSERDGREITEIINLKGTTTTKKTWPKTRKPPQNRSITGQLTRC